MESPTKKVAARKYERINRVKLMPELSMATISVFWANRLVNQMIVRKTMKPLRRLPK
jgi:hypothetical protein